MNFNEEYLKKHRISSISLITERSMAPLLVINTVDYGKKKFKSEKLEKCVNEVVREIKIKDRIKKINKIIGN